MCGRYHQARVASRWQDAWDEAGVYELDDAVADPLFVLGMFPYTSGSIHMGHVRNYSITDAYARFRRMQGADVLHPMGWDAFGLPAENAAHERAIDPASWTERCIEQMREQLRDLGFGYDWSRELTTCEPAYYRWNQWLFKRFHEAGLVDYTEAAVNWCPDCETVLADAQVKTDGDTEGNRAVRPSAPRTVESGACWRCGTPVDTRSLPQWFFRITDYADELADALDDLGGWPESVREIQRHWIGRQRGAEVTFELSNGEAVSVFTTRVDTIYGATYLAVSATHPIAASRHDAERAEDEAEWWGHETDLTAIHPLTGDELPVWIAGYVVPEAGTGAVMGVPAHNERDYQFATTHDLPISRVVVPDEDASSPVPDTDDGSLQDSGPYTDLESATARERLESEPSIEPSTTFRLRDWLISRQRYWGTPIPVIHCGSCGPVLVPDEDLPVTLPPFEPSRGNPLAESEPFVETVCPECGEPAERETDTMDTFVDSSWYFLRFLSPRLSMAPYDVERVNAALPVDVYVGGAEHATLHLLYLRFVARALADLDLLDVREPIERLLNQGTVLHGGRKMSKSIGNVVAPHEYGAETTRLFVLSAAHPERDFEWTAANVTNAYELQQDLYELVADFGPETGSRDASGPRDRYLEREVDRTIAAATEEYAAFRFHQAIAEVDQLASLLRQYRAYDSPNRYTYHRALRSITALIAPAAPFLAEELWRLLDEEGLVAEAAWPEPLQPTESYELERALVDRLRSDVREIVGVAGIDEPDLIELTIAADWKFTLYGIARDVGDADAYFAAIREASVVTDDRDAYVAELAGRLAELEPILPAERERGLLERAAWLLQDEFDADVEVGQEGVDADTDPDARPNRPGIDIR